MVRLPPRAKPGLFGLLPGPGRRRVQREGLSPSPPDHRSAKPICPKHRTIAVALEALLIHRGSLSKARHLKEHPNVPLPKLTPPRLWLADQSIVVPFDPRTHRGRPPDVHRREAEVPWLEMSGLGRADFDSRPDRSPSTRS